jgi:SPP1 gp7 family putative phage head morphogenesis protein
MLRASLGDGPSVEFRPPSPNVPAAVVGISGDGGPLAAVLVENAGKAAALARQELVIGVIRGKGPREIARNVSRASGIAYNRSLLIARTESIRAYRTTTLDGFQQNPSVVQAWAWQCTFDVRTCAACWAMSGTIHSTDESLNSHPGCRCSMLPQTASWADLGFPGIEDTQYKPPLGTDVFDRLPASDQRKILGPGKYAAYADGRITLPDLVQPTRSARWGPGRREKSLRAALAA